jgi:hypothetical protein
MASSSPLDYRDIAMNTSNESVRRFSECREELQNKLLGQFKLLQNAGGSATESSIDVQCGGWHVSLDRRTVPVRNSTISYTRLRTRYERVDGFRFRVYRKTLLSFVAVWLGMQDVELGSEEFDEQFIIQGNNQHKISTLLSNTKLRELLTEQPGVQLTLSDDDSCGASAATDQPISHAPRAIAQLCLETSDKIDEEHELLRFYNLFAETLLELDRLTSP